ncbi:DUF5597 domain-containing protein [Arthrobacter sp. SA17]
MPLRTPAASPHREFVGDRYYLNGRPFLIVGAELHNSSSSTAIAIEQSLELVRDLNANTVLAPISWELVEPEEGEFDFTLVDALYTTTASMGLHLIPLWFGSWKNGMSTYTPRWVKTDPVRFPLIETRSQETLPALSPFHAEARKADAKAFAAVMRRLGELDDGHTLLMVQVENEVGVLGSARDHSCSAEEVWKAPVPEEVLHSIANSGDGRLQGAWSVNGSPRGVAWGETFADEAPEAFMAFAFASYVNSVAGAGRSELTVPFIVNAWLNMNPDEVVSGKSLQFTGGQNAGDYPSGGPLPHTAMIWRAIATEIDCLAPDFYVGDLDWICRRYREISGALVIPEMRRDRVGIGQMFRAVGEHRAAGVSPFGVDSLERGTSEFAHLADALTLLRAVGCIFASYPGATTYGFTLTQELTEVTVTTADFTVVVGADVMSEIFPPTYPAYGCIVVIDQMTFFAVGRGFTLTFPASGHCQHLAILQSAELAMVDQGFRVIRRLNGDESGSFLRLPGLEQSQTDVSPIPRVLRTSGIVRVELYRF